MVNGRSLEYELKRINDYFDALSIEAYEEMALDCGAGVIAPSSESVYVEVLPKQYSSTGNRGDCCLEKSVYTMTPEETEAA